MLRRLWVQDPFRIQWLSRELRAGYVVFDLLHQSGRSWMSRPLEERRARLVESLEGRSLDCVRISPGVRGRGREFFRRVQEHGQEGMMAKQLASPYVPGRRLGYWQKVLCRPRILEGPAGQSLDGAALLPGVGEEHPFRAPRPRWPSAP